MPDSVERQMEQVISILVGPSLPGGDRDQGRGMVRKLDKTAARVEHMDNRLTTVERAIASGGVKAKIPVPVSVAIITTMGVVIAEALGLIGRGG